MIVYSYSPEQLPGVRRNTVDNCSGVAKEGCKTWSGFLIDAPDDYGRAHACRCLEPPVHTPRRGVECIDHSTLAAHEDMTAGDCGLSASAHVARETESPLQLQAWALGGGESSGGRVLSARVGQICSPATPLRSRQQILGIGRPCTHGLARWVCCRCVP